MTPLTDILGALIVLLDKMPVIPAGVLAAVAVIWVNHESKKRHDLERRHEQLRKDFDEFINEILQKKSSQSDKKEV
ncbi:MAG: hypothetical protein SPL21_12055 [Fibrobacter sp.]|nr:hypothetical protein [Fibrobacter sp.]